MSLPALTKSWQFNVNNVVLPDSNWPWHQKLLLSLKNALIGFPLNPWVVVGSCDSLSFAMDGTDYWSDYPDLIWDWSADPHAWIVLENVAGVQLCLDLNYRRDYDPHQLKGYMSSGGLFTGGSTTVRPTATDEHNIMTGASNAWFGAETTNPLLDYVWHMWHSEDGAVTRLIGFYQNNPHTIWRFEKFQDARAGHAVPYGFGIYSGTRVTNMVDIADQEDADQMRSDHGGVDLAIYCIGLGRSGKNMMELGDASVLEEIDGDAEFAEVGYLCDTIGGRGPKGKAYDMWWGQYQVVWAGDTYPDNASARDFVQFGCFIFPWTGDATVPLTA